MVPCTKIFFILISLSLVYQSAAIYCYSCNSVEINGTACLDPKNVDDETRSLIPIILCEEGVTRAGVKFFCRKSVQTIYLPGHQGQVRVTRSCGWERHEQPCYRTKHVEVLETSCQCFTNMCNSAESIDTTAVIALFLVFSAILYWYR